MTFLRRPVLIGALGFFSVLAAIPAQVPNTLKHAIFSPSSYPQTGAEQGTSVALDGTLAVISAHFDDTRETDSGVVKVFNAVTGQLLHTIINPTPAGDDYFGSSVAVSGQRVVVGAIGDDFGALDAGRAYVYDLASSTPTVPIATLNNPAPAQSDRYGCSVAISGNLVVVGARTNDTPIADAGSAYVYNLAGPSPTVPVATLNNPDPAADEYFGTSVAIDGSRVVVGANWENTGATRTGSAYLYELISANPTLPILTINNPKPVAGDSFAGSVAISGKRVVVSALGADVGQDNAGSVYIFDVTSATPAMPVETLNDTGFYRNGYFGIAIGISGSRVVVGAQRNSAGGVLASGIAFIFDLESTTPRTPVKTLHEPSPGAGDNFARAVAVSGTIALVSASRDDTFARDAGRTWVYDATSDGPSAATLTLDHPSPAAGDGFGVAVAISGTRLIVGAEREDTAMEDAGSAYIYDLGRATPAVPFVTLHHPRPTSSAEYFGSAVGISGTRAVVGAWRGNGNGFRGRAWVYNFSSATPALPILTLEDSIPNSFFAAAVAISGTHVVVGAYGDDTGQSDAGRVYVYDLARSTPAVPLIAINNPAPSDSARFGIALAISGTRLVVGAPSARVGSVFAGAAYVFDLASASPTIPIATLSNPSPGDGDYFGRSVGISGSLVVVGAAFDDLGATDAGRAYVYDLSSPTPTAPHVTLNNPTPAEIESFGYSVAVSGKRVVIGAHLDAIGGANVGRAYVYDFGSPSPSVPVATLGKASPVDGDTFGFAVAIDGPTVAVGAPRDDSTIANKGAAYVFAPQSNDFDGDGLLDIWEHAYFGTLAGHTAGDDSDGDGASDLLELALDRNPAIYDTKSAPLALSENGFLTVTLSKRAGVNYLVETSSSPDAAAFSAAETTVLIDSPTTLKARDNFSIGGAPQRFIRVRVTPAP